jgi:hypothetical protein
MILMKYSVTTEPFRSCDEKNFGVSTYCKIDPSERLPKPQVSRNSRKKIKYLKYESNFLSIDLLLKKNAKSNFFGRRNIENSKRLMFLTSGRTSEFLL